MENQETQSVKEQVRQRREQGQSFRQIAQGLGVTKHTVEKAVKELAADSAREYFRTAAPGPRTPQQPAAIGGQTVRPMQSDSAEFASDAVQTPRQTAQNGQQRGAFTFFSTASGHVFALETPPQRARNAENGPKTWYFDGVFTFMTDYHCFLRDLQRLVPQNKKMLAHTLRINQVKQLGILVAKAKAHCLKQGLAYDSLLLSEALGACEAYLQGALGTVVVNPALWGFDSVRLTHDEELMGICKRGLMQRSFFAERGHGS